MAQQVCHLSGCQRLNAPILQLYPVHQVGCEGVTQTVQALFLYSSGRKDTVITLSEIHRPSEIPVLVWHQRCVLAEVGFLSQVLDHSDGSVIQRYTLPPFPN